jgi:hypothetical protein
VGKIKVRSASVTVSTHGGESDAELSATIDCYSRQDAEWLAELLRDLVEPEEPINPPEGE